MVCPDRWLGAVPKRPSSCVWTLGVTSTNVPPSPATFWPFAAANRQNAIATRARPRPGRGGATPREGPEPPRADEIERADIYRLCRRDIHFRHLTSQRRASSVCPFFLPMSMSGVSSSHSQLRKREKEKRRKAGSDAAARRPERQRASCLFVTHLFPMSTSHMKIRSVLFPFSKLRRFEGIFRFHSHRFPTDGTCPARLHERRTRSPFQDSSSSSLEVERTSLELLCSAPQRSRLRPKSTDCPFPRQLGSLASPPPGPPVRAPFSVSGARTLPAIASRVARSSATSSVRRSSVPTRLKRVSCPSRRRKNIPRC